jgi:hypothetical protein
MVAGSVAHECTARVASRNLRLARREGGVGVVNSSANTNLRRGESLPKVGLGVLGVAEISRMRWVESGHAPLGGVTSCQSLIKGISRLLWPENSIRRSSVIQPGSTRELIWALLGKAAPRLLGQEPLSGLDLQSLR